MHQSYVTQKAPFSVTEIPLRRSMAPLCRLNAPHQLRLLCGILVVAASGCPLRPTAVIHRCPLAGASPSFQCPLSHAEPA
jgi:hypothetical protein